MSHTPHALAEEFPAQALKISAKQEHDAHFSKLVAQYNDINDRVHRAEIRLDLLSQDEEEALRRERARLKDLIWHLVK